jgi:hypothetical protein
VDISSKNKGVIVYTRSKKFRESKSVAICKFCKSNKVHWAQTEYGWLLYNKKSGKRHMCKQYKKAKGEI